MQHWACLRLTVALVVVLALASVAAASLLRAGKPGAARHHGGRPGAHRHRGDSAPP